MKRQASDRDTEIDAQKKRHQELTTKTQDLTQMIAKIKQQISDKALLMQRIAELRREVRNLRFKLGFQDKSGNDKERSGRSTKSKKQADNKKHKDSKAFVGASLK